MTPVAQPLLRHLRRRLAREIPDAKLVRDYATCRSDEAFGRLVDRHGPMVLGICRRVLGTSPDAEDAFQATFVVLARKAGSLRRPERVAAWLCGVARQVALRARTARDRRTRHEAVVRPQASSESLTDPSDCELLLALDEELALFFSDTFSFQAMLVSSTAPWVAP